MFAADQETYVALQTIDALIGTSGRPLVLWIGAGASMWAGYPSWVDLTSQMHSMFSREELAYDKNSASKLLLEGNYPGVFECMKVANRFKYNASLAQSLRSRDTTEVYRRFLRSLRNIAPLYVVTTNVDETLERHMPGPELVQHSDIERLPTLIYQRRSFICKLHGSASAVETAVFASSDYEEITQDQHYMSVLRGILGEAHVLFLGYGLSDQYVVRALSKSNQDHPLFGIGPHFVVTSNNAPGLPENVQRVRYIAEMADHREALLSLEIVAQASRRHTDAIADCHAIESIKPRESIYYLADLMAPGTWTTSQTMSITSENSDAKQMIIGPGYVNGEIHVHNYSALHDIVVGLICFDSICIGVWSIGMVHQLLGAPKFWELVVSGAIRVVFTPRDPAVLFQDEGSVIGSMEFMAHGSRRASLGQFSPLTVGEIIRRQLTPNDGQKNEAEHCFQILESTMFDLSVGNPNNLGDRTRAALVHPSVRRLLGMSGGTPINSVPRWLAYPLLRLAGVVSTGSICQRIGASAARLVWGSESLASAAFSASVGQEWADNAASYVLTGRYNSDIGMLFEADPTLLSHVVAFRQSQGGEVFRREVAQRLETNEGGLLAAAVNAGLRQAIPPVALQSARDQLSGLFEPRGQIAKLTPAVFGDLRNADICIAGWRKRSRAMLDVECKRLGTGPYNTCPCGSGEKLKFCCLAALS